MMSIHNVQLTDSQLNMLIKITTRIESKFDQPGKADPQWLNFKHLIDTLQDTAQNQIANV
jgi:hypothetical protein